MTRDPIRAYRETYGRDDREFKAMRQWADLLL